MPDTIWRRNSGECTGYSTTTGNKVYFGTDLKLNGRAHSLILYRY
jgi:hypothetical protein